MKLRFDASTATKEPLIWPAFLTLFTLFVLLYPMRRWVLLSRVEYCDDPACQLLVAEVRRSLSPVRPCENFYKFVCARWQRSNRPFADQTQRRKMLYTHRLAFSMLALNTSKHRQGAVEKAARLYMACRKTPFTEDCDLDPLRSIMKNLNIEWPFVKAVPPTPHHLLLIVISAQLRHGIDLLFEGGVKATKTGTQVFHIGKLLDPEPLLANPAALAVLIRRTASLLSGAGNYSTLASLVVEEETNLGKFIETSDNSRDVLVRVREAVVIFRQLPWLSILSTINTEIKLRSRLTSQHRFLLNNASVLAATEIVGKTDKSLHAFLGWRIVRQLAPLGCASLALDLARTTGGNLDEAADTLTNVALKHLQRYMPVAVAVPYIMLEHLDEVKDHMEAVMGYVKQSIQNSLNAAVYLDPNFRATATETLDNLVAHFLYPDFDHLDAEVSGMYWHLPSFEGDCLWMTLTLIAAGRRHEYEMLGTDDAQYGEEWRVVPTGLNITYVPAANALFVQLGVASLPLYVRNGPLAWNFGAYGRYLAAEILTAMFKMAGDNDNLTARVSCFGNTTRDVFVAFTDSCAVDSVNHAYEEAQYWLLEDQVEEVNLRQLSSYSGTQLYFLASCFPLCGEMDTESEERCNLPLKNSEDFAISFGCAPDSPMNPAAKCEVC